MKTLLRNDVRARQNVEEIQKIVKETKLQHIAFIMDGNRRWAKKRFLPSAAGHNEGVKALKATVRAASDFNVKYVTVYAFSTENWDRKPEEVNFLMKLFAETITKELSELDEEGVKITIIGDLKRLSPDLRASLNSAMEHTAGNKGVNLQIALNYGGRDEITNAFKTIAEEIENGNLKSSDINQDLISDYLYTSNIPDPDLLVRTGGEQRVSNYLLWQIAYAEFFVTQKLWPEFDANELALAIKTFGMRNRRFGAD